MIGESLGSYRIVDTLGEGGMGVVYIAEHSLLGRKAAVKRLLPEYSNNKDMVERFFNEARAAAMIKHPGIVQIFDFGYADNGSAYIVMEYLEGEGLTSRIEGVGRLPADEVYHLTRQVAGALAAAHNAGIIHRDLKPDNIHIVRDPQVPGGERTKVLDFGIAKLLGNSPATAKTRTGAMMGSPMYMSPEQCRGAGEVDLRADIYSLGCVMYHMATGRPPFEGDGVGEIIGKHIYEVPVEPRSFAPDLPDALQAIIMCTLAKEPDARYATMDDLVRAIDDATGARFAMASQSSPGYGRAPSHPVAPVAVGTEPPVQTTLGISAGEIAGPIGSVVDTGKQSWLMPLAAVLLLGGGATLFALTRGGGDPEDTRPVPAAAPAPEPERQVEPTPPPPVDLVPEKITVKIASTPGGAGVFNVATGVKIGKTPFEKQYDVSDGELVVVLRLKGHVPLELSLALDADRSETVALEKRSRKKKKKQEVATKPPPKAPEPVIKKKKKKKKAEWGKTFNPLEDDSP